MATVRITAVQMQVSMNIEENLRNLLRHIEKHETDYIVFPEMCLTGWHGGFSQKSAERAWEEIAEACRKRYTTAIFGTGCQENGAIYNQARVISDAGELIGTQDKLVPTKDERAWCHPGEELQVFEHGEFRFGCLVGNDLWVAPGLGAYPDPRLSFRLSERGAQVIFHCAHTGADPSYSAYYESNIVLRAKESGCFIVSANAATGTGKVNAQTGIVAPEGVWVSACARQGEQVCHADVEVE